MNRKDSDYTPEAEIESRTPFFRYTQGPDVGAIAVISILIGGTLVLIGVVLWGLITLL
jgi:hypothetical protein